MARPAVGLAHLRPGRAAHSLRCYRDDVLVAEVTGAAAQSCNGVTMGLRLHHAADAAWFPQDRLSDSSTPDRLSMDVDWVRVWAAKP